MDDEFVTVLVQIGNSDDKLIQAVWAKFYESVTEAITAVEQNRWFSGASSPTASWQNAAWVFSMPRHKTEFLKQKLGLIAGEYNQDSIAEGVIQFVGGYNP